MRTRVFGLAALAAVVALPGAAAARPFHRHHHDGWHRELHGTGGAGLGMGHLACRAEDGTDCDGAGATRAGSISVRGGVMLAPDLALTANLWAMSYSDDSTTTSQSIVAAVLRSWVAPALWLEGGLGVARATSRMDLGGVSVESHTDYVPAVQAGIGYEFASTRRLAFDVNLGVGSGLYQSDVQILNVALGLGVSVY